MAIRKNIVLLAQHIEQSKTEYTEKDPEYYALDCLLTDEQCDVALFMERRKPISAEKLAKKAKMPLDYVAQKLEELARVHVVEYKLVNGVRYYILPVFAPGILEFLCMDEKLLEEHPELAEAFRYCTVKAGPRAPMVPVGVTGMRTVPVVSSLPTGTKVASYEDLSYWLQKYKDHLNVGNCACRATRRIQGEGCGHLEKDMCIVVGDTGDYLREQGLARKITYEEALEILRRAEDNGLVHQVTSIDGPDHVFGICNCCVCSCLGLNVSQYYGTPNISRSNYVASVDPSKCVACGQCVDNCQVNAVKLGQSLHSRTEIKIHTIPLPDQLEWSEKMYHPDYRDAKVSTVPSGTAPCKVECPAHIAIQGYIKLAAMGRYREALELIKKENPFPAICGSVCNRRCEFACTRGGIDAPIAIDEIKKFIAAQELNAEHRYVPPMLNTTGKRYGIKMAVIGAGPAGMSCAYFLQNQGYDVTVFEKEQRPGGMMMHGIPNFRLEKKVVEAEIDILREMGVEFRCGVEVGRDITLQQLREQGYRAFYVAIGLQSGGRLGIPGDEAEGVIAGIDFSRSVNAHGKGQLSGKVVVIGGGNIAADIARTAVRSGAESVDLFCLECYDDMPMGAEDRGECEDEGITIHAGWGQTAISAKDGKCTGIRFRRCLSVKNAEGRFAPVFDDAQTMDFACSTVLYCIGQKVSWGSLLSGTKVQLNGNGTAIADSLTCQTGEADIFAGGDAVTGQKFIIDAIAAGKEAAISMHRFVHPGQSLTIGRNRRIYTMLDKENAIVESYDNTPRQRPGHRAADRLSYNDDRMPFTEEQLKKETARCLGCGVAIVDQNKCLGCGICTIKCKFEAISLSKKFNRAPVTQEQRVAAVLPHALKRKLKIKLQGEKHINIADLK